MATVQIIWCREDKSVIGPEGQTYASVNDANAALRRHISKRGGAVSEPGRKTYDVVAVTVP